MFTLENDWNLLVLKNIEIQIKFIQFLIESNFHDSVWVSKKTLNKIKSYQIETDWSYYD